MDSHTDTTSGRVYKVITLLLLIASTAAARASLSPSSPPASNAPQISSNSVLVALLDSHYTELAELVEKALLLPSLEAAVGSHNLTIFAPRNAALERDLDPELKRFLLEPRNLNSLQALLLFHVLPRRVPAADLPALASSAHDTLCPHHPHAVHPSAVVHPDAVVRPDGVIHGIDRLLVPRAVQEAFNRRRSLRSISAVKPQGAPDPRTRKLKLDPMPKQQQQPQPPTGDPPALLIHDAMAPGPSSSLAPAPAPGPGGPTAHFDGASHVKDFIHTLLHYGGYSEMADILVNLTSLASEIGKLVSEGYVVTLLAPNDEAMARLTTDDLGEPGAAEQIVYYHIIPEYQTEESMYNAVRRFQKVSYDTLRLPFRLVAQEADGSVKFGEGDGSAFLFEPDIFTDGRISVQGIDSVLRPPTTEAKEANEKPRAKTPLKVVKQRRGKLLEVVCSIVGAFGQGSHFTTCQ